MNPLTGRRRRLLLIEDSESDAELIIAALEDAGIGAEILHLVDGGAAADFLLARTPETKNRALPDWILLDLKLPKLSGLDVLRLLRENAETSKIPVVIFTSSSEERDLIESYRLNVNSYVQKPVGFDEFSRAVRELALYWSRMNLYPLRWDRAVTPR